VAFDGLAVIAISIRGRAGHVAELISALPNPVCNSSFARRRR